MNLASDQVSEEEVAVILRELATVFKAKVAGDVVEFGCYIGTTSLYLQKALLEEGSGRTLHMYDSFQGLPNKRTEDESPAGIQFKVGELLASKQQLIQNFKRAGLVLPVIHKSWFSDLSSVDVPDEIAFAFLDGDYFDSILDPLKLIWPVLSLGAVVVVDDYQNEQLPGVKKALDVWRQHHSFRLRVEASLAIIRRDE